MHRCNNPLTQQGPHQFPPLAHTQGHVVLLHPESRGSPSWSSPLDMLMIWGPPRLMESETLMETHTLFPKPPGDADVCRSLRTTLPEQWLSRGNAHTHYLGVSLKCPFKCSRCGAGSQKFLFQLVPRFEKQSLLHSTLSYIWPHRGNGTFLPR